MICLPIVPSLHVSRRLLRVMHVFMCHAPRFVHPIAFEDEARLNVI
jgi:hypothetical protein